MTEFTSNIPHVSGQCNKILQDFKKSGHLKIIEMIKEKDADGIEKELSREPIQCHDKSMNFNFFHLAAIFGDKEVFNTLLKSPCQKYLYFSNDKLNALTPVEYAILVGNKDVVELLQSHYQNKDVLKKPEFFEAKFCDLVNSNLILFKSVSSVGIDVGANQAMERFIPEHPTASERNKNVVINL